MHAVEIANMNLCQVKVKTSSSIIHKAALLLDERFRQLLRLHEFTSLQLQYMLHTNIHAAANKNDAMYNMRNSRYTCIVLTRKTSHYKDSQTKTLQRELQDWGILQRM